MTTEPETRPTILSEIVALLDRRLREACEPVWRRYGGEKATDDVRRAARIAAIADAIEDVIGIASAEDAMMIYEFGAYMMREIPSGEGFDEFAWDMYGEVCMVAEKSIVGLPTDDIRTVRDQIRWWREFTDDSVPNDAMKESFFTTLSQSIERIRDAAKERAAERPEGGAA